MHYFARLSISAVIYLIAVSPAFSGDLYLLSINSRQELETVESIVDHAHGTIGPRFIVEIDDSQMLQLTAVGISVELVAKDADRDRFFVINRVHPAALKTAVYFEPKFSFGGSHLVEMAPAELDILRKEGYLAIPLADLKTPFFYLPPVQPAPTPQDFPLDGLADLVSQDSLYSYDTRLEQFYTRYIDSDSIRNARDWLVGKFQEFGYTDISIDTFYYSLGSLIPCHNVMCYKPGTSDSDKLIVIGGHYDSYNTQSDPSIFAPGADDNASGTATMLELARVLKNVETKKSILFAAFSAEEVGLVGSYYMAGRLFDQGADLECMLNFDMVAFTEDEYDNISISGNEPPVYADVLGQAAQRVSTLIPDVNSSPGASDHMSFQSFGYMVGFVIESDFNIDGWHTNIDISSRLDFPYFEQVVRMAVAAVGHIDVAANPTPIEEVWDVGDGQSLRIVWGDCESTYDYKILYGTQSGVYTDTIEVPSPSDCRYDLTGLTSGQRYYFSVLGTNPEGFGPLYLIENSGIPYVVPRAPSGLVAEPDYQRIILAWAPNWELDLSHYRLLRRAVGGDWLTLEDNIAMTAFYDTTPVPHVEYEYAILAVDKDQYVSDSSQTASAVAATFDYPLLFVEETSSSGALNPSEDEQAAYYDSVFSGIAYDKVSVDNDYPRLSRSLEGQYGSIFWVDDDVSSQMFSSSRDSVTWYLGYGNNFLLGGYRTLIWVHGEGSLEPGDFLYDNFGVSGITNNSDFDFTGASGEGGWPDLQNRTDVAFAGILAEIPKLEVRPGADVIYRFNSATGDPAFDGQPVGVAYKTGSGRRIALGFPIYHLTHESARALTAKVADYFGYGEPYLYGDFNEDGRLNIVDVADFVRYLYKSGPPPSDIDYADPNGDCAVDISDIIYLIKYLYMNGPEPVAGCAE
jgi:aminopeptidase YwaD